MTRLLVLVLAASLFAQDRDARSAQDILRDFDGVSMPSFSSGSDPESLRRFEAAIREGSERKAAFALELFAAHPDHARTPRAMEIRWASLSNVMQDHAAVVVETSMLLEKDDVAPELAHIALRARTHAIVESELSTNRERLEAVREFLAAHPKDMYVGMELLSTVVGHLADPECIRPLLELAVERWPDSAYVGRPAKRWLAVFDMIGVRLADKMPEAVREPFLAALVDAPKFTVVQLWTGWVARGRGGREITALRALREEFGQDLRLVGLLDGDLAERLPAAKEAGVDWPQLEIRDPEPFRSPFGVGRMPCYFVLDSGLTIVGITGSAEAAALRLRQLAE